MTTRAERRRVERVYAKLPRLECKGLCHESCGPIGMSRVEWERVKEAGGERIADSLTCPYLNADNRCDVYEVRPLICRLWGAVPEMPCEHGCKPERYINGHPLLAEMQEAGS